MITRFQCTTKAVNVAYSNSFSNQWAFTTLETEVFKYHFLKFYIAKTMLCILWKFCTVDIKYIVIGLVIIRYKALLKDRLCRF